MKIHYRAVLFLLAIITVVTVAPLLLRMEQVQSVIIGRLQKELSCEVRIETVRWHWWPVPFISLKDIHIHNNSLQLAAPAAEFHPSWLAILSGHGSAGLIVLRQPLCHLKVPAFQETAISRRLPQLALMVEDGVLSLPPGMLPPEIKAGGMQVSGINGQIKFSDDLLEVQTTGTTPFCREIAVDGIWRLPDNSHQSRIQISGLNLHELIPSMAGLAMAPVESAVNLKAEVRGHGLADLKADLKGEFPYFLVKFRSGELPFTRGLVDLSLIRSDTGLELAVNNLEVKEPGLNLSGRILRSPPDGGLQPLWHIDLLARDLDIAQVREKARILLDTDSIIDRVADVLRSGIAPSLRFRFSGPAEELAQLKRLSIEGQIEKAAIRVPAVDLSLEQVEGQFAIKEGKLSGQGLRAELGGSRGWNGSLLLTLTGPLAIELDLDLDAELAELAGVLHKTVRHEDFLREVDRFGGIEGRGSPFARAARFPGFSGTDSSA